MIRKILNGKSKTITSAAILLGITSLLSRFLGILRDRILAGQFGAGSELDMYYAAFRIPDLIYNLLVLGALSAGFIPVLIEVMHKNDGDAKASVVPADIDDEDGLNKEKAWDLSNAVLNIMGLSIIFICAILAIFAVPLTRLLAPGFDAEQIRITANLSRIMFLSPLFLGISSIWGGILQSFKRFLVYSVAPIFYNLGIIAGAIFLGPDWGVYALAVGVVAGAFLHMAVQIPSVCMLGYRYSFKIFFDLHVKKITKLMVPRTLSLAISQLNLFVMTIIATTLAAGSLSAFNFANNIQSFPIGIFGVSFALAAFPTLSVLAARGEKEEFIKNYSNTVRQILFFIIPATILLVIFRAQITRIILGTGKFDWQDTTMTMQTLGYLSISLFAQSVIPLVIRAFYAFHDSFTPFLAGLISSLVNIFFCYLFVAQGRGVAGLGLAFSLSSIVNLILLWIPLRIKIGSLDEKNIVFSILKISLAGIALALSAQWLKTYLGNFFGTQTFLAVLIQCLAAGSISLVIYCLICLLLKSSEMQAFWNGLRARLPWLKLPAVGEEARSFE